MNILKDMWDKVEYIFLDSKQMFIEQNLKFLETFTYNYVVYGLQRKFKRVEEKRPE